MEISAEDHNALPWVNLLALIAEQSTADPDVQAKAMTLINKVGRREGGGEREREKIGKGRVRGRGRGRGRENELRMGCLKNKR